MKLKQLRRVIQHTKCKVNVSQFGTKRRTANVFVDNSSLIKTGNEA